MKTRIHPLMFFQAFFFGGTRLWVGLNDQVVAEIFYNEPESAKLVARCLRTGKVLWSTCITDLRLNHGRGETRMAWSAPRRGLCVSRTL